MLAVGAAVFLAGYTLIFWGARIRSGIGGVGLADVVVPGRYERGPLPPVTGGAGSPSSSGGSGAGPPRGSASPGSYPTQPAPVVPSPGGSRSWWEPPTSPALPSYPAPVFP